MSQVMKCDGPGCTATRDPALTEWRLSERGWLRVEDQEGAHDFHDTDCLTKWAGGFTTSVDLSELRTAWDSAPRPPAGQHSINILLAREWPDLVRALNRLLDT